MHKNIDESLRNIQNMPVNMKVSALYSSGNESMISLSMFYRVEGHEYKVSVFQPKWATSTNLQPINPHKKLPAYL
jgi:hypothetical protein